MGFALRTQMWIGKAVLYRNRIGGMINPPFHTNWHSGKCNARNILYLVRLTSRFNFSTFCSRLS